MEFIAFTELIKTSILFNKYASEIDFILDFYNLSKSALLRGEDFEKIVKLAVREGISRMKYIEEINMVEFDKIEEELKQSYA